MRSDQDRLRDAVAAVASVEGVRMPANVLANDLVALLHAYGAGFETAVESLVRALGDVAGGRVSTSPLKYELAHVRSYHFQSVVAQGQRADMRLAFIPRAWGIEVVGFGHRRLPQDFYAEISRRSAGA